MQNTAVVRVIDERLAWYPPGASDEPQWLDDAVAMENLRSILSRRRMRVCFAVPGADARLLTLPVTAAEKKHIAKSLPFTLEERVAEDVEDLHFAYCTLDKNNLAVAVCGVHHMEGWQQLLDAFPGISQWLPEPLSLPWKTGEWCLVVENKTAIVRIGQAEGFTVEKELLSPMLAGVLREHPVPGAVIVYGSDQDADTALLPDEVQALVQWRNGNFYSALMLSEAESLNLNLLQGNFAPRLPFARWWQQWRIVAAVFALAFVLQLVGSYADYRQLAAQNLALRSQVEESYRQVFPRGAVVDAEKQLSRQLDALRGTQQSSGFISLMERVGKVIASMPGTEIATINYNDKSDEMRLNIIAADFEGVEQLRSRINGAGLEAKMESSSAEGDRVRARLRVGAGS